MSAAALRDLNSYRLTIYYYIVIFGFIKEPFSLQAGGYR